MFATSCTVASRLISEVGRFLAMNYFSISASDVPCSCVNLLACKAMHRGVLGL